MFLARIRSHPTEGASRPARAKKLLLLGVPLVLVAAACIPAYQGNPQGTKIAIIGDSITYVSDASFHAQLDETHSVSVDGKPGMKVADLQDDATEYARTHPDVVVINLGTNDGAAAATPLSAALGLLYMASKFPDACVVLTTLNTHTGSPGLNAFSADLNTGIRQGRFVDWDAIAWARGMTYDTVHPSRDGADILAELTADVVARACK